MGAKLTTQAQLDRADDLTAELRSLVRKLKFWKYTLLIVLSAVCIAFAIATTTDADKYPSLWSNLASSAITGLILSIVYDLFVKRENDLTSKVDLNELGQQISARILGAYGPKVIPDDQLRRFFDEATADDRALMALASTITDSDIKRDTLCATVLRPLFRDPLLVDVHVKNILHVAGNDSEKYVWELEQSFRLDSQKDRFRCILTADNDIGSQLNSARDQCDALILVSPGKGVGIRDLVHSARVGLKWDRVIEGDRLVSDIDPTIKTTPLSETFSPWPEAWNDHIAVIEFPLEKHGTHGTYTLSFQTLNRFEDSFFYWVADRPCHVNVIEIDYSRIREFIGRVAVIPTLSGRSVQTLSDRDRGRIEIRADCILWPGQGVFCVWRPHYKSRSDSLGYDGVVGSASPVLGGSGPSRDGQRGGSDGSA